MNVSTTSTIETNIDSPTSEPSLGHLSASTLSMRAKAERKRKITAVHNNNFRAGFVPVTEEALRRSGIRGRKRYFLYCTLVVMLIIALLNSLVTAWFIYILGMTHIGLHSIEMSSYGVGSILRVLHQAHIITVTMNGAPLGARLNSNLNFVSDEAPLYVQSAPHVSKVASTISLNGHNITLTTDSLRFRSDKKDKWFSADVESVASRFGISNFFVEDLVIRKIHSRKDMKDLYLESATRDVIVNASRGMTMKSHREMEFHARSISLQSMGNLTFSSKYGMYLNPDLPKAPHRRSSASNPEVHKVFLCEDGKLFFVPCTGTGSGTSCRIGRKAAKVVCGM